MNKAALSGWAWPEEAASLPRRLAFASESAGNAQTVAGSGAGTLGWIEGETKVPLKAFLTGWRGVGGHSSHPQETPCGGRSASQMGVAGSSALSDEML